MPYRKMQDLVGTNFPINDHYQIAFKAPILGYALGREELYRDACLSSDFQPGVDYAEQLPYMTLTYVEYSSGQVYTLAVRLEVAEKIMGRSLEPYIQAPCHQSRTVTLDVVNKSAFDLYRLPGKDNPSFKPVIGRGDVEKIATEIKSYKSGKGVKALPLKLEMLEVYEAWAKRTKGAQVGRAPEFEWGGRAELTLKVFTDSALWDAEFIALNYYHPNGTAFHPDRVEYGALHRRKYPSKELAATATTMDGWVILKLDVVQTDRNDQPIQNDFYKSPGMSHVEFYSNDDAQRRVEAFAELLSLFDAETPERAEPTLDKQKPFFTTTTQTEIEVELLTAADKDGLDSLEAVDNKGGFTAQQLQEQDERFTRKLVELTNSIKPTPWQRFKRWWRYLNTP